MRVIPGLTGFLAVLVLGMLALGPALAQVRTVRTADGVIQVETIAAGLEHPWGLAQLPDGRLLVTERPGRLRRILPDGTPFDIPEDVDHPTPLEIGPNVRNEIIYLMLPEQQPGGVEVVTNGRTNPAARYAASAYRAFDAVAKTGQTLVSTSTCR
ncbi:MAG: type VI secretion system baseplate subunit TssK, partial [Methylacidiphilales bacterium]|nr:type VI secretion system baseplate subunit TssK [Candidatus Methylacidiphilales bacterium]